MKEYINKVQNIRTLMAKLFPLKVKSTLNKCLGHVLCYPHIFHYLFSPSPIQSNPIRSNRARPFGCVLFSHFAGVALTHTIVTGRSVENMNTTWAC